MRKITNLTLTVTASVALLSAAGCSSPEGGGGNGSLPGFQGLAGANNGAAGTTGGGIVGGGGQSGVIGGPGGPGNEGTGGTSFNAGVGGAATGVGGGAAGPVVDVAPQETPGGYFVSGAWRGYAWSGDDALGIGTTRAPLDYTELPEGAPFCLSGAVGPDPESAPGAGDGYGGVALLGFNVSQEQFGLVEGQEPTLGAVLPTGTGVAVNFTKMGGYTLRIQLQGPNGETDASQRWCADLTAVLAPAFIPYTSFRTNCWELATSPLSVPYTTTPTPTTPITAVVMTVPGDDTDAIAYNVCVAGFADGNGPEDAPDSIGLPAGLLTGVMSGVASKFKVVGRDGNTYIVNNNAWGTNSRDGTQQIRYTANSFEILRQSAGPGGDSSPASFPSIYIGANGAQTGVNGATTTGENPLPIQVSAINSLPTRFRNNATSGDYNATYDVWFAPAPPQGEYDTALAAFLMVWTYKPGGRVAIGNRGANPVMVDGRPWFLYVGPRGGGGPDANLPVISYVNEGAAIQDYSFDLDVFIQDAVGRNIGLTNAMYLTDVFAGFEIWNGGQGLRVDEFTAEVNP